MSGRPCAICGREIRRRKRNAPKTRQKYCDFACYREAQRRAAKARAS